MPAHPQLNDAVSIAMAAMVAQTPPHTPPRQITNKPSKRSARIPDGIRPLRGFSIFHRSISLPEAKPADPATNVCMYCKSLGHWSNDCPLSCTLCAKHAKDARGHTASNCSPMCEACDGLGTIKRHNGDERATEMLALESCVKALSIMALEAKTRVDRGVQSNTKEDLKSHLDRAIMYAKMAMQDLEKLGDALSGKDAGGELEQDGKFHVDSLDPFNDCHEY